MKKKENKEPFYVQITLNKGTEKSETFTGQFTQKNVDTYAQWDDVTAVRLTGEEVVFPKTGITFPPAFTGPTAFAPPVHDW